MLKWLSQRFRRKELPEWVFVDTNLGQLTWNYQWKSWLGVLTVKGIDVTIVVPGQPPTTVSSVCLQMLASIKPNLATIHDMAIDYLSIKLSDNVNNMNCTPELNLEQIHLFDNLGEFEMQFEWQYEPESITWLRFKDENPANWGIAD